MQTLSSNELIITILALTLLLVSATLFGKISELLKIPKVVGEILGGLVLGMSCLGLIRPDIFDIIFNGYEAEHKVLDTFYQIGLMILMFSSGYTTIIKVNKQNFKTYMLLLLGATIIPTIIGIPFISIFSTNFIGSSNNYVSYAIVFLISMSITSIPVISKIFFDINMMNTRYANMVLSVATIQDLILWIALNLATSVADGSELNTKRFVITTLLTILLLVSVRLVESRTKYIHKYFRENKVGISVITLFVTVIILSKLSINIMYSSFIAGCLVRALIGADDTEVLKIKDIGFGVFIPIYFALVGIKLDIIHNFSLSRFILFFIVAFGAEFIGTVLVMWFSKLSKQAVISLGITMNARGGPGIVLATTAYSCGIISIEFFTVLIITTMVSSAIAGYWLRINRDSIKNEG